ncbi:zinc finger protein 844 [Vespula maculifrons]|uniref:Zinc finger protein 844 n=1 Tax=Vespula maculifrons TaxID=7453 RepID=A0ABD2CNW8_VESMC
MSIGIYASSRLIGSLPDQLGQSPERGVRLAEYGSAQPTSDGASECGSETSSECPEELYNLTKLAEVSLAAAAGTLIHPNNLIYQRSSSPRCTDPTEKCSRAVMPRTKDHHHHHHHHHHLHQQQRLQERRNTYEEEQSLERTRFFFESIENEREMLGIKRLSPHHPRHHHRNHHHHQTNHPREETPFVTENKIEPPPKVTNVSEPPSPTAQQARRTIQSNLENAKSEDNEDHECPDCGKKYSTSSNLARHRQTHRSLGDKKARRCPHCDKVYVSMPAFSMHVRTHNQGCKCHYCGKTNEPASTALDALNDSQTTTTTAMATTSTTTMASCMTASPTSVIVPRLGLQRDQACPPSAFSAIIKHTGASENVTPPPAKRPFKELDGKSQETKTTEIVSSMVIRTSVISPNPEHLGRFNEAKKPSNTFDYPESTRTSAFSRPTTMTLNLAIATKLCNRAEKNFTLFRCQRCRFPTRDH